MNRRTKDSEFQVYFETMRSQMMPPLTKEMELELTKRAYNGQDRQARDKLVRSNLALVVCIFHQFARKYHVEQSYLLDYLQEGNLALSKAAESYVDQGARFSSFAGRAIYNSFRNFQSKQNKQPKGFGHSYGDFDLVDGLPSTEIDPSERGLVMLVIQEAEETLRGRGFSERDLEIFFRSYGDVGSRKLKRVANRVGLTKSRISTIKKRAEDSLK